MGCSSSIVSKNSLINHINSRYLENILVIWICDETSNKFYEEQKQLQILIHGFKIFHHINECLTFLSMINDEKILLIISGSLKTIQLFEHLTQIERIYIFNTINQHIHQMKYQYINNEIHTDINQLYQQIQNDLQLYEIDSISFTIISRSLKEISNKNDAAFIFGQMIKEIIYRLKFDNGAKDVFIDFCQHYYENNHEQLLIINDFANNYRPHQALIWLQRECFLSRILNRAIRTREIDIIYKLGFFIKHINRQLNRLYEENLFNMINISTVYRGKTMINEEFESQLKNSSGYFLSFSHFLFATNNKNHVMNFIHQRLILHPNRIGIIFEINIDQTIFNEKCPFALLKDINDDNICFHINTVFSIQSIEQIMNNEKIIWLIKLKQINDDDPQLIILTKLARCDEIHANPVLYLGKLLVDMGEYRCAEQVLLGLLKDPSIRNQPRRLARAYNGLGDIYTYTNEYNKALYHYQQLLQINLTYLQSNHSDLSSVYTAIANTYFIQKNYHLAMKNYDKAMELLQSSIQPVNSEILNNLSARINESKNLMK